MSRYTELTEMAGTRWLDTVRPAQEAVAVAVETVDSLVSRLPLADRVPSLPFAGKLPSRAEVVRANYAFAERMLHEQREFLLRLVTASERSVRVVVPQQGGARDDDRAKAGA